MKLGKFTPDHLKGMVLGIVTPMIFIPVVLLIISWLQNYDYSFLWHKFVHNADYKVRILTISAIANLIGFYFFLNRERYNISRGIILGSLAFAPYVIYVKFF